MKFRFENVGPIKDARIELGSLTIVCGKNNTGKTYLTNCLYEFYKTISRRCSVRVQEEFSPNSTTISVDLEKYRHAAVQSIIDRAEVFAESTSALHGGDFHVEIDEDELPLECPVPESIWSSRLQHGKFEVKKVGTTLEISRRESVGEEKPQDETDRKKQWHTVLNTLVNAHLFRQDLNGGFIGDACSLTSERMGIIYFKDCLDIAMRAQSQNQDLPVDDTVVSQTPGKPNILPLFPKNVYSMLDMISFWGQRRKMDHEKTKSHIKDATVDLEKLAGGTFDVKDNKIVFAPSGSADLSIDMQDVSSSVRALFALDTYVRYFSEKGDLLVIDEPEMNLHPEKQRQLARFLARLVNKGIKVFITTHSDYILREFNTLIELSGKRPYLQKIRETEGYSDHELLRASDVRAYVSREEEGSYVFDSAPVSEDKGLEIAAIDAVIDDMNRIQDLIDWGV